MKFPKLARQESHALAMKVGLIKVGGSMIAVKKKAPRRIALAGVLAGVGVLMWAF